MLLRPGLIYPKGAAISAPFAPSQIPGLVLWLRGDVSPITLNGSNVSQWDDLSGKGNHPVQAIEANQPDDLASGINGRRNVDFVAANEDRLDIPDDTTIQNIFDGGGYIGGAVRPDTLDATARNIITSEGVWQLSASSAKLSWVQVFGGDNGSWDTPAASIVAGAPFFFGMAYNSDDAANNPAFTIDGATVAAAETATPTGTRTTDAGVVKSVGNRPAGSRPWDGPMAELVLYSQPVSAANQTRLNQYFSQIHGIGLA